MSEWTLQCPRCNDRQGPFFKVKCSCKIVCGQCLIRCQEIRCLNYVCKDHVPSQWCPVCKMCPDCCPTAISGCTMADCVIDDGSMTMIHMCESCHDCYASCDDHNRGTKKLCGYCGVWCTTCQEQVQRTRYIFYRIGDLADVCDKCYAKVNENVNENTMNGIDGLSNIVMGYLVSNAKVLR